MAFDKKTDETNICNRRLITEFRSILFTDGGINKGSINMQLFVENKIGS